MWILLFPHLECWPESTFIIQSHRCFETVVTRLTDVKDPSFFKTQDCLPTCDCDHIAFRNSSALNRAKWKMLRDELRRHGYAEEAMKGGSAHLRLLMRDHYELLHDTKLII